MKKVLFALIGLAMFSCTDPQEELVVGARTTAEFSKTEHDFGTNVSGDILTTSFEIKNTGEIPLRLIKVNPSCGCTTPDYPKEPIMPGESGEILVNVDTKGMTGNLVKTVTVISNTDPVKQRLDLKADLTDKK